MPMEKFDLDTAKSLITQSREDAGLTDENSAELFASVVNCMVIDIVDLASSTLKGKEKNDKVAVDAINVVMDFMDHAASLFDAVAKVRETIRSQLNVVFVSMFGTEDAIISNSNT